MVGYGKVRGFVELSVGEAWRCFGQGNGSAVIGRFLELLNSSSSVKEEIGWDTRIGNTIMDEVVCLEEPVKIEDKGVVVKSQVVRGRSLSMGEEAVLLER